MLDRDDALRCGVLFAHGDHFTAGLDLAQWAPHFGRGRFPELPEGAVDPLGLDEASRVSKPVVLAVPLRVFSVLSVQPRRLDAMPNRGDMVLLNLFYPIDSSWAAFS